MDTSLPLDTYSVTEIIDYLSESIRQSNGLDFCNEEQIESLMSLLEDNSQRARRG